MTTTAKTMSQDMAPSNYPKRIDFKLAPFMASDDRIASWQILNTVVPIIAVAIAMSAVTTSFNITAIVMTPLLLVLMVLLLSRSFSLMHDCGHQSLFRSKRWNRIAGFGLSLIHGMPQHPWSRGHAFHHKHNGNWDRYRGPAALITREDYEARSPLSQWLYRILRHPLLLFPGGFFYLIIKSRVALLLSFFEFIGHSIKSIIKMMMTGSWISPRKVCMNYKSSFFYPSGECVDMIANTAVVGMLWWWIGSSIGYAHFWILYALIMSSSAAVMIAVFFIQHNFPESYTSSDENWSYFRGALSGSSFLQMPAVLNWFTADIAYHHIHHLSERIPNYRLKECHEANIHLVNDVHKLYLSQVNVCFSLILWDRDRLELVSPIA
jgi:omega-6 fatty acid desaturase (delta-12 desaturase)